MSSREKIPFIFLLEDSVHQLAKREIKLTTNEAKKALRDNTEQAAKVVRNPQTVQVVTKPRNEAIVSAGVVDTNPCRACGAGKK
jgi:hypothetical protein